MRFTKQKELAKAYWNSSKKQETKFLWFPLTIDGETRWLETATIEYKVDYDKSLFDNSRDYYWKPWSFVNQ